MNNNPSPLEYLASFAITFFYRRGHDGGARVGFKWMRGDSHMASLKN